MSMPEEERTGMYDPTEEVPWDCDISLSEWGWEEEDEEEGEEGE